MIVTYDDTVDCLYASVSGEVIHTYAVTSGDRCQVNVDVDRNGNAIGVEVTGVPKIAAEWWMLPGRSSIPPQFFSAIGEWINRRA